MLHNPFPSSVAALSRKAGAIDCPALRPPRSPDIVNSKARIIASSLQSHKPPEVFIRNYVFMFGTINAS